MPGRGGAGSTTVAVLIVLLLHVVFSVAEGVVAKKFGKRWKHLYPHEPVYIHLFNDLLVYCSIPTFGDVTKANID